MNKLTGVIIAKNEEFMIEDALKSISFCDEIIVIDNDSKDKTKQIAEKNKAIAYNTSSDDFSELRNLAIEKASHEWILYLDADERIDEQLKESIENVLKIGSEYSAFKLNRRNFYLGKNEWPKIEKLERLFKKDKIKKWFGKIHESPIVDGKTGNLTGYINHYTHRGLESMLNKTIEWSSAEALARYNLGHPKMTWWRFPRVMISSFFDSYVIQRGFKTGSVGLIESMYQAYSTFITYAKLWELQQKSKIKS